jgi:hypothetical protein
MHSALHVQLSLMRTEQQRSFQVYTSPEAVPVLLLCVVRQHCSMR